MVYRVVLWVQGGCIIRAGFLDDIKNAYKRNPDLENLVLDDWFAKKLAERQDAWRDVVKIAISNGRFSVHALSTPPLLASSFLCCVLSLLCCSICLQMLSRLLSIGCSALPFWQI